jgi:hypothetical protein
MEPVSFVWEHAKAEALYLFTGVWGAFIALNQFDWFIGVLSVALFFAGVRLVQLKWDLAQAS